MIYNKISFKIQSQRTDWNLTAKQLNSDYEKFLNNEYDLLTPLQKYDFFINTIIQAVARHTPKKRKFNKKNHRNPAAWWDLNCDSIKRLRQAAFKKWEVTNDINDYIEYKRNRAIARKTFKTKKKEWFHKFAGSLDVKTNTKFTWNTAKVLKNKWIKINPLSRDEFLQKNDKIETALKDLCPE